MQTELTQEVLKEVLEYNAETGLFTWKIGKLVGKKVGCEFKSNKSDQLYTRIKLKGKNYLAHRLVWLYIYGNFPDKFIDHVDGNGLNNRVSNLREVDEVLNGRNSSISKNNTSGINGVSWDKTTGKWVSRVSYTLDGSRKWEYLGSFENIEDARQSRLAWEESQGNFTKRHGT